MLTKNEIKTAREQIQEDLLCLLDGMPDDLQTKACQIVVDNMNKLIDNCSE
jgi:hypothetical protein